MPGERRGVTRRRFFWGVAFLVFGASALLVNLGVMDIRDWWENWPLLLIVLGALHLAWPGTARERLSGFWLLGVGIYGYVSVFELFGLNWGTAWPILLVALGIRIVLSGLFQEPCAPGEQRGPTTGAGPSSTGQGSTDRGGAS